MAKGYWNNHPEELNRVLTKLKRVCKTATGWDQVTRIMGERKAVLVYLVGKHNIKTPKMQHGGPRVYITEKRYYKQLKEGV